MPELQQAHTWVTQHNSESWRPISVGKWDTFDLLRNCSSNVITLFRGVDNLHKIDNERIRWDTEIGWMMADLKCGLAVRIISGIFPFLDPGRGRHQMEDSSGDNQAEGADTASTRSRNQALCHYIDTHTHTQTNIIWPVSTDMAQNVSILGKYVID